MRQNLLAGQVIIGSVLSQKLNLKVGDFLPLETKEGIKELPICGVANEYMVGGLAVHMAPNMPSSGWESKGSMATSSN